jgi:Rad9
MDVVIPSHSVRLFGAAISSLSRIGSKDLYLEFDPVTGLSIRTLNDAKSAYACVHYEPTFFERCTAPPTTTAAAVAATNMKRSRDKDNSDDDDNSVELNVRFSCRVSLKALSPVVRPRRNVHSLRIRSCESATGDDGTGTSTSLLEFEFAMQHTNDTLLTAIHRVRVADAVGVSAVANTEGASEIVVAPAVLWRLLEPLQRTVEAALIVRNNNSNSTNSSGSVSASSFHHSDAVATTTTNKSRAANNNAILQATSASLLKSETACGCDEFLDFDFVSDRELLDDNVDDEMPEEVNQEVILVFSIKEAKSMLHFCCSQPELVVNLSFHWGGKPLVMKASTDSYSVQLVLATLDYKLLTSMRTMASTTES